MIRASLAAIARAVAKLAGVPSRPPLASSDFGDSDMDGVWPVISREPVKVLPLPPLCSVESMHSWEAAWDPESGSVAYWSCTCCGKVQGSFGEVA